MKYAIFAIILTSFTITAAFGNREFSRQLYKDSLDENGNEKFKVRLVFKKKKYKEDHSGESLNLALSAYLMNEELKFKDLVFPRRSTRITFKRSIKKELRSPQNTALYYILKITRQCLFGSIESATILNTCTSDKVFNRLDYLTDMSDDSEASELISDLYFMIEALRDQKDEITAMIPKSEAVNQDESNPNKVDFKNSETKEPTATVE